MKANRITEQRDAGLISASEARTALRRLAKQAQFNADYSDHIDSYKRWTNEAVAAHRAVANVPESKDDSELRKAFEYAARRKAARGRLPDHLCDADTLMLRVARCQ